MTEHPSALGQRTPPRALRVLFLCTGNAARSQIAEAILAKKGSGRFEVASAGVTPAAAVHPMTVEALHEFGIDWTDHAPKGYEAAMGQHWDFIITVCDSAREACPTFPDHPVYAHWGVEDPAAVEDEDKRWRAFRQAVQIMARRVDLMLALPIEKLARHALEQRLKAIGETITPEHDPFAIPAAPGAPRPAAG